MALKPHRNFAWHSRALDRRAKYARQRQFSWGTSAYRGVSKQ
jgi:hypothetical protein